MFDGPEWMNRQDLADLGFDITRPEIDYGMRWGADRDVRVAFCPDGVSNRGFLYAHHPTTGLYSILNADTTRQAIDAARFQLGARINEPDGFLAWAANLSHQPAFTAIDAHRLWLDCVEADLAARRAYETLDLDAPDRFDGAFRCVVATAARVSAEQTYIDALCAAGHTPVVIGYRLTDHPGWDGRLPAAGLRSALGDIDNLHGLAAKHGLAVEAAATSGPLLDATSLTRPHALVSRRLQLGGPPQPEPDTHHLTM